MDEEAAKIIVEKTRNTPSDKRHALYNTFSHDSVKYIHGAAILLTRKTIQQSSQTLAIQGVLRIISRVKATEVQSRDASAFELLAQLGISSPNDGCCFRQIEKSSYIVRPTDNKFLVQFTFDTKARTSSQLASK